MMADRYNVSIDPHQRGARGHPRSLLHGVHDVVVEATQ